ncbi:MAG: hypothetical protein KDK91_30170 [Gammaproteobacteria bacterium]|nr:hypothetical protein [Gammaproteobacteria bacterium]
MLTLHPLRATLLTVLLCGASGLALACTPREPTPPTDAGPHDFSHSGTESRLWQESDPGEPLFLRARVLDTCGQPLANAMVRVLHANHEGVHEHDRWRTVLQTDERGVFRVTTVFPGFTGGIPRHIHFIIEHPEHPQLVTRLFFQNDPDSKWAPEALAMVLEEVSQQGRKGWVASYEFVLGQR